MQRFCVLLLAGGKSRRMGVCKALLEWDGMTFAQRIAAQFSGFEERYLSAGADAGVRLPLWRPLPDLIPGCGPMSGLHAAASRCSAPWLFAVSCDLPRLDVSLAEHLMGQADDSCDAVIPVTPDGQIHPLCAAYRKTLSGIFEAHLRDGHYKLRNTFSEFRVRYVPVDEQNGFAEMLTNINTPEDYQLLLARRP